MAQNKISEKTKRKVHERAKECCEYCQSSDRWATHRFYIEHIFPKSKGGSNDIDNLALGCPGCNNHKYNKIFVQDPLDGKKVRLFHPRKDKWTSHFVWDNSLTKIVGITAIGRVTVIALKLNRERLITRREAFILMGFHPPKHTLLE